MKLGAAIVETRNLPNLVDIIRDHMNFLPDFGLTVFCSDDNYEVLNNNFDNVINLKTQITISTYNFILTSVKFWSCIPYEKILIFQHDSKILRKGIGEFLEWDYVGSPWKFPPYVGNGGISLRSKKAMIDTILSVQYNPLNHGNEDTYFCNNLVGKIAPLRVAEKFSCETKFKLGTFAYHSIDKYLTKNQVKLIQNQYD